MISVVEATRRILRHARRWGTEKVPVADAVGRVLGEAVRADRDYPPYNRSTMDGIALSHAAFAGGLRAFRVERLLPAGQPGGKLRDPAGCIRIMTGAELPHGCTCVVPKEEFELKEDFAVVGKKTKAEEGQFIHRKGSDRKKGDVLLTPGAWLSGQRVSVCVSAGRRLLEVSRQPRMAVVSSGDEVIDLGKPVRAFEVRPSNQYGIRAALETWGFGDVATFHVRDRRSEVKRVLKKALAEHDVLITTGGVSEGEVDFIPGVLLELGVKNIFHKVAQRPGKPLWFGVARGGKLVFGLPGNPVSTQVCLRRYVAPTLVAASGMKLSGPERVILAGPIKPSETLTRFVPVTVRQDGEGRVLAEAVRYAGSGDLAALATSDGFVELPPRRRDYGAGELVDYIGWSA